MKKMSIKDIILKIILIIIIVFLIRLVIVLTQGFWYSPLFTTPTEKLLSVIKSWGFLLVCLGAMILSSRSYGRELRGEKKPKTTKKYNIPIFIAYIIWVIIWQLLDPSTSNRHYLILLGGWLIITFVWYELDTDRLKELWWKIVE